MVIKCVLLLEAIGRALVKYEGIWDFNLKMRNLFVSDENHKCYAL